MARHILRLLFPTLGLAMLWACTRNICDVDSDCGSGLTCQQGSCMLSCNTAADCLQSQACEQGVCVDQSLVPDASRVNLDAAVDPLDAATPDAAASRDAAAQTQDAAQPQDAAVQPQDAGPSDAGLGLDAGATDSGSNPDAGGSTPDAAAPSPDSGAVPDADGGCPDGTVSAFVDQDQDGVGAGPPACLDPMVEGTSLTNTDCAPLDPAAYENRLVHPDGDGDEITTTPVMRCAGVIPPTGTFFDARPAGVLGLWGDVTNVAGPGVTWTNPTYATFANDSPAECRLTNATTCDALQAVGFNFVGPLPATLGGLRAAVRLRPEGGSLDVTVAVQLRVNGMVLATATRTNVTLVGTGSSGYTWVAFGGPGDLWVQTTLPSPADITLRVLISTPTAVTRTIRADGISIMVFPPTGALDCNDADPLRWSLLPGFTDGDGDYWGSGATTACLGPTITSGFTWRDGDCADDDNRAHPGAEPQTTPINGNLGWDFDCDGTVEPAAVTNHAACVANPDPDGGPATCLPTDAPLAPNAMQCGTSLANQTCDMTCMAVAGAQTVACR